MSNYIGVRCPVCNKKFAETDDIVVCPICGAPHHRDCYAAKNQCAFVEDHLSGKEWNDPAVQTAAGEDAQQEANTVQSCTRCGAANPMDSFFCQICGHPLAANPANRQTQTNTHQWGMPGFQVQVDTISMAYGGLDPESEIQGEKVKDLAQYIGSGSAYYLPRFQMLSESNRSVSFNFCAMFFGCFYYFYRKMYLLGGFLLAMMLISHIPSYLQVWELLPDALYQNGLLPAGGVDEAMVAHLQGLSEIVRFVDTVIVVIVSLFANKYYMNRTISSVHDIRMRREQDHVEQPVYEAKLIREGGCNRSLVVLLLIAYVGLSFLISAAMIYQLIL